MTSDEKLLRQKAREAIQAGRIPADRPEGVWGGPGSGAACTLCDQPVRRDGLGFDLVFAQRAGKAPAVHHVHIRCFAAWEFECQGFLQAAPDDGTISTRERNSHHNRGPQC
jgi:hypothetical protein